MIRVEAYLGEDGVGIVRLHFRNDDGECTVYISRNAALTMATALVKAQTQAEVLERGAGAN